MAARQRRVSWKVQNASTEAADVRLASHGRSGRTHRSGDGSGGSASSPGADKDMAGGGGGKGERRWQQPRPTPGAGRARGRHKGSSRGAAAKAVRIGRGVVVEQASASRRWVAPSAVDVRAGGGRGGLVWKKKTERPVERGFWEGARGAASVTAPAGAMRPARPRRAAEVDPRGPRRPPQLTPAQRADRLASAKFACS